MYKYAWSVKFLYTSPLVEGEHDKSLNDHVNMQVIYGCD